MASRFYRLPETIGVLVCLGVFLVGEYVVRLESQRESEALRGEAIARASTVRARVEAELNSTIYLGIGLSGYLSLGPDLEETAVMRMLAAIYERGHDIRNIGLAPNNRISYIYPLAGNEAALGLKYESVPEQWPGVKRAMEEKSTVVVGPVALVQGGYGIITRTPVFLTDGSYWGIVSMVVDITALLERVSATYHAPGSRWALRANSSDASPYVYGDPALFDGGSVRLPVTLPGGVWEIAVASGHGAGQGVLGSRVPVRRLLNVPVALLVGLLFYLVLRERTVIHHMAVHDTLTGLPNRRLLFERLEQRIALAVRYDNAFCIIYVDLDRFKPVNDEYGHRCGDLVLCEVADRMRNVIRGSDTVARVGGDEFVILLPDTSEVSGAEHVRRNLIEAIEKPIRTDRGELSVSASMGIGRYPDHGKTPEELIGNTDSAMYAEKDRTRDTPRPGRGRG